MKKEVINIAGEEKGVIFDENPDERLLLVYIHGGPLYPEIFLIEKYFPDLMKQFQCVFPETRECGLSSNATQKKLEVNVLVEDIIEWVEYFLKKFNKDTCVIMRHSFGTVTASLAVKKRPALFSAYIGIGQVNSMYEHQKIVYDFVKDCCEKEGNIEFLQKFPNKLEIEFATNRDYYMFTDKYISKHRRGIFNGRKYSNFNMMKDLFSYRKYSLGEKFRFMSVLFSPKAVPLISEFMVQTYGAVVGELSVPVFIFNGKYDLMTCPEQAKVFFDTITAPQKEFYLYEQSAHFPMFDEPQRFNEDIEKIKVIILNQ